MTRSAAWSTVLDGQWYEQWQAHRERLEFIQSASSVSTQAFTSALAAAAHPHRIHTNRDGPRVKLVSRSNSPAAKARQRQIDHDNLLLIKKIIALDNVQAATSSCGVIKKRTAARSRGKNTIVVPLASHSNRECLHPTSKVPHTAASHVLYTRSSATMKNNFVEYNAPTMKHASNTISAAARVRSRAQSKILEENKKIIRRILGVQTTVKRSDLERHQEKHQKLRATMSRYSSTSRLPPQQQPRSLRLSCSQSALNEDTKLLPVTAKSSDSVLCADPVSHLEQYTKCRPRSSLHTSSRSRGSVSCRKPMNGARNAASSESLVYRIRKMTVENPSDEERGET